MRKPVNPVRKLFCSLLLLALALVCTAALAADQEYSLDAISARVTIGDTWIVLTPDHLADHPELLSRLGKTQEEAEADWAERGVLLQAWTAKQDICLEITAVQDEEAKKYFDLDQQSSKIRSEYRTMHLKDTRFNNETFDIKTADWKTQTNGGRFLMLKYKTSEGGTPRWGYARKTIRNGFTILLDYQVLTGRALKETDLKTLNKITNTVSFTARGEVLTESSALLHFTSEPPAETNTGAFTVEGNCVSGAHVIGVLMRMSSDRVLKYETDANKKGDFKIKVTLPEEGVWLLSLTIDQNNVTVAEHAFQPTTYSKTLMPVALTAAIPESITTDELVISGVTSKTVTVQCIATNGGYTYTKQVKTNGSGKFTFKVPTALAGDYEIVLAFSKKGLNDRRLTYTTTRVITEEYTREKARSEAVKPSYTVLTNKLNGYVGKTVTYPVYIVRSEQLGEETILQAALREVNGGYKDLIIIVAPEDPGYEPGSRHRFYGLCTGLFQIQSEEGQTGYPSFDLLFWE